MTAKRIKASIRKRILERDGYACQICGVTRADMTIVVDHIIARALGGTDEDGNLRALCAPCNHDKSLEEFVHWLARERGLAQV